jgi:hypothetical protein
MQLTFLEVFQNVDVDDLDYVLIVQDHLHMFEVI